LIATLVEVDVKVRIDETGRVVKAEPLPGTEPVSSSLVGAARNAAMQWRFEPARRGNQPLPSDLVLKFQYRPAVSQ
jgi:outer membrane biosynthesis protein TonB